MKKITIYDADANCNIDVSVIRSVEIAEGTWHEVEFDDLRFAIIAHESDIVSQNDWQGQTVEIGEIETETWRDVTPRPLQLKQIDEDMVWMDGGEGRELPIYEVLNDGNEYHDNVIVDEQGAVKKVAQSPSGFWDEEVLTAEQYREALNIEYEIVG